MGGHFAATVMSQTLAHERRQLRHLPSAALQGRLRRALNHLAQNYKLHFMLHHGADRSTVEGAVDEFTLPMS